MHKLFLQGNEIPEDLINEEHPPLVHLLDFSLNITHYHFHLLPTEDNNVSIFIKKLNIGFAKYFNLKYGSRGSLIYQPGWRENGLIDPGKAREFLEHYEFSSFSDKIGKRNSKILASEEICKEYSISITSKKDYNKLVNEFLNQRTRCVGYSEFV